MLLATYRSDELDRRHPLMRKVQVWRTAGLAETITVSAMSPAKVAEMIAVILNADEVSAELAGLVGARADGNPFVLEEMLREALDRGEIVRTETGWGRTSHDALRMPRNSARGGAARLARLDTAQIEVLRARPCSVGRSTTRCSSVSRRQTKRSCWPLSSRPSVSSSWSREPTRAPLPMASRAHPGGDRRGHGRAEAPANPLPGGRRLLEAGGSPMAVARHLLGSGRTKEAAEACLRAAEEAERAVAYSEAAELLERVLPNVTDQREHALLLSRMGYLRWLNGEPAAAEQLLVDAIGQLDGLGLSVEAARARVRLGRCRWELDRPDEALQDFEHAQRVLDDEGPSPDSHSST